MMAVNMKRRGFVKALFVAPAAPALLGQQAPAPGVPANPAPGIPLNPTQSVPPPASASNELPKIDIMVPDAAAEPMPHFFARAEFAALQRLSGILMPSVNGAAGALEAKAPEFLDFLIGDSPSDRQHLYRAGLNALNAAATKRFNKPFSELDAAQADAVLAPLRQPWTYEDPADPLARFLRVAKADIRTATVNSREFNNAAAGGRRFGGSGTYWYPLD